VAKRIWLEQAIHAWRVCQGCAPGADPRADPLTLAGPVDSFRDCVLALKLDEQIFTNQSLGQSIQNDERL
jgi:hypothetical protein